MSDALYYERPVLLNRDKHRHRKVLPSTSYAFAQKANSLYLAGVEFNAACKEYAIVFTRAADGRTVPVAMLGLRSRENLFVDEEGRWSGTYVPAFVRRYPFVFSTAADRQTLTLCIDEAHKGVNREGKGRRLFDDDGRRAGLRLAKSVATTTGVIIGTYEPA